MHSPRVRRTMSTARQRQPGVDTRITVAAELVTVFRSQLFGIGRRSLRVYQSDDICTRCHPLPTTSTSHATTYESKPACKQRTLCDTYDIYRVSDLRPPSKTTMKATPTSTRTKLHTPQACQAACTPRQFPTPASTAQAWGRPTPAPPPPRAAA